MKIQHTEVLKLLNIHDDESFENEDAASSNKLFAASHGKLSARLLSCMFFTVFSATKNVVISSWWGIFVLVYSSLQLLALTFVSNPDETPVPAFAWIKTNLDFLTFRSVVTSTSSVVQIAFFVVLFMIALTIVLGLWVGKQFWFASHISSPIVSMILHYLLHLEMTILYMPFITILATSVSCDNGVAACDGGAGYYLLVTGVVIILFAFVSLMCFVALVATENNPLAHDVGVAPHGRIFATRYLVAGFANTLCTFLAGENIPIHIAAVLVCGIVITALYIQYLPFYRPFYNRFASALYSMTVWGGICLLISYVLNDTNRNVFVACLLMGLPLILAASYLFVIVRESQLGQLEVERGMSAYTAEVILRCKWQERAYGPKVAEYRKIVDELYAEDSFMLLHLSSMFYASGSASLLAGQYLSKSNRCRVKPIDIRFRIFRAFRKQHEEKNNESGSVNYMTLKHHQMNAESNILDALNNIQYLFDSLLGGTLTPSGLFTIANKVDRASVRAKENLDMLIKLTKSAPRTLLLYSLYASEILFDFPLSKRLHKAAHEAFRQNGMDDQSHLDAVTIVISGNEANIGVILDCSDNIENAYGHVPADVIGTNVDSLCPPPINNGVHERFLRHYIETAVNFVPVTRTVWIRHIEGYYVRCALSISPVQDNDTGNLIFQGKLTKTQQDVDFMGVRATGEILFYSAGVLKSFGLRSFFEKGNGQEVNIQSAIPATKDIDFQGMYEQLQNNSNYTESVVIETGPGESYKLNIYPKVFPQAGVKFTVIDLKLVADKVYVESESESEDSDDSGEDEEAVDVFERIQSVQSLDDTTVTSKARGDDETGSAKSDSKSTVRAASRMRSAIRVGIVGEKRRFQKFRKLAWFSAFAFIVLAVLGIVANHVVFSNVTESIDSFHQSGQRVVLVLESGTAFLTLINTANISANETALVYETISTNANEIEVVHETILHSSASQAAGIQNLQYNSSLASEYHSDHTMSLLSFNSLVLTLVAKMRAFVNTGTFTCESSCQYVVNNAQWDLVDIAMQMITLYKENVIDTFGVVQYINLSLVLFSSIVVLVVLVFFITPRLLEVKRVKDEVSVSVGRIQSSTLKRICAFNAQRAHKVSMMINHINKAQNPFQVDASQFGRDVRVGKSLQNVMKQAGTSEKRGGGGGLFSFIFCCRRKSQMNAIHPSGDKVAGERQDFKERGLSTSLIWSFVKMTVPLLLIAVYFGVIYAANNSLKEDAILYLNSLNANVIRYVNFQKLTFASHTPTTNPPSWSRWFDNPTLYNETVTVETMYEYINSANNVIEYGNVDGTGSPFIDKTSSPDLYSLYFVDACTPVESCVLALETIPDYPVIVSLQSGIQVMVDGILSRTQDFLNGVSTSIISFAAAFPLADANDLCVQMFEDNLISRINTVQGATLALSLVAIVVFVFVFAFLVRVFRGINNELVDAQSLFLLLPADVLDSIPDLSRIVGVNSV